MSGVSGGERLLVERLQRAARHGTAFVVLALHLSRLPHPGPRPHHIYVARVLLQDTCALFDGEIFSMRNQDLVLVARGGGEAEAAAPKDRAGAIQAPEVLGKTLNRLFAADTPVGVELTQLWRLPGQADAVLAFVAACAQGGAGPGDGSEPKRTGHDPVLELNVLRTVLSRADMAGLMAVRTGVQSSPVGRAGGPFDLQPAFRSLRVSLAALNLGPLIQNVTADPFLRQHLAALLDSHVIAALQGLIASGLGHREGAGPLPLHVNLTPPAVLSAEFAALAREAAGRGLRLRIRLEASYLGADTRMWRAIQRSAAELGWGNIIVQLDAPQSNMLARLAVPAWGTELVWSDTMERHAFGQAGLVAGSKGGLGVAASVLSHVDTRSAFLWGQAQGFTLFEGSYVDERLAAKRMLTCRFAQDCTVLQCGERARSTVSRGRAGCRSPETLDAGGAV